MNPDPSPPRPAALVPPPKGAAGRGSTCRLPGRRDQLDAGFAMSIGPPSATGHVYWHGALIKVKGRRQTIGDNSSPATQDKSRNANAKPATAITAATA